MLAKPREGDMYSSWQRVRGDGLEHLPKISVIVWGARDPELMKLFDVPVARVKKNT